MQCQTTEKAKQKDKWEELAMTAERFNVILNGITLSGEPVGAVAPKLAKLIKRDLDFATALLQGKPTKIKSGVDAATGARYVEALQRVGVGVRLEPETLDVDANIALPQAGRDVASRSIASMETPRTQTSVVRPRPPAEVVTATPTAQSKGNVIIIVIVVGLMIVGGAFGGYRYFSIKHESNKGEGQTSAVASVALAIAGPCDKSFLVQLEENKDLTHLQRLEAAKNRCNGKEVAVSGTVSDVGRGGERSVDIVGPDGLEYSLFLSPASQCGDTVLLQKGQKISIRGTISSGLPHFPKYYVNNVVCVK